MRKIMRILSGMLTNGCLRVSESFLQAAVRTGPCHETELFLLYLQLGQNTITTL